jgi:hypothetical protein
LLMGNEFRHVGVVAGELQMTSYREFAVLPDEIDEPSPHRPAPSRQGQFGGMATLLAHAPVIHATCLCTASAPFEKNDGGAPAAGVQCCGAAREAAPDDGDVKAGHVFVSLSPSVGPASPAPVPGSAQRQQYRLPLAPRSAPPPSAHRHAPGNGPCRAV